MCARNYPTNYSVTYTIMHYKSCCKDVTDAIATQDMKGTYLKGLLVDFNFEILEISRHSTQQ